MNNEFNNQFENNNMNSQYSNNYNNKNDNWKNVLIIILIFISLFLTVLTIYVVVDKKDTDVDNKDNNIQENENNDSSRGDKVLDEYYLKTTDIIDEHILEYRYSAIADNKISYNDFRKNYVVKNIIDSLNLVSNVGCGDKNTVNHVNDTVDKNGVEYPDYCGNGSCVENIAKDFGLTVDEISKMDKNVWNSNLGGQYCYNMYDAKEVKHKYVDVYNDIFSSSFSIYLSDAIYGVGYFYRYDKNLDKIIASGHGGTAGFDERVILNKYEENNLYKVTFVEGYFSPGGKWMSLDIDSNEDIANSSEASEVVKRNKDKLPNYEITFEKTSTGYKFKDIRKIDIKEEESKIQEEIKSTVNVTAVQVENRYTVYQTLSKEFATTGSCMKDWAGLNSSYYKNCTYSVDSKGTATVILEGKGKFADYKHCEGTRNSIVSCNKSDN